MRGDPASVTAITTRESPVTPALAVVDTVSKDVDVLNPGFRFTYLINPPFVVLTTTYSLPYTSDAADTTT